MGCPSMNRWPSGERRASSRMPHGSSCGAFRTAAPAATARCKRRQRRRPRDTRHSCDRRVRRRAEHRTAPEHELHVTSTTEAPVPGSTSSNRTRGHRGTRRRNGRGHELPTQDESERSARQDSYTVRPLYGASAAVIVTWRCARISGPALPRRSASELPRVGAPAPRGYEGSAFGLKSEPRARDASPT